MAYSTQDTYNGIRTLLNDEEEITWRNSLIEPKLTIAVLELEAYLNSHSIPSSSCNFSDIFIVPRTVELIRQSTGNFSGQYNISGPEAQFHLNLIRLNNGGA
jgi:hypothetical protein